MAPVSKENRMPHKKNHASTEEKSVTMPFAFIKPNLDNSYIGGINVVTLFNSKNC